MAGLAALATGGGGGDPFGGGFGDFGQGRQGGMDGFQSLDELFEEMFTGRRRGPRRGQDMQYPLRCSPI